MPGRSSSVCGYRGCAEPAHYVVELDGKSVPLCREHFKSLLRRLEARASEEGAASLDQLSLTEDGDGAVAIRRRRGNR